MKYISSATLFFSVLSLVSAFVAPLDVKPEITYSLVLREDTTKALDSLHSKLVVEDIPLFSAGDVGDDNGRKFMFPDGIQANGGTMLRNLHKGEGYLVRPSKLSKGNMPVSTKGKRKDAQTRGVLAVNGGVGIKLMAGKALWVNKDGELATGDEDSAAIWMINETTERTRRSTSRIMGKR